jgi:hypothetical protein
VDPWLIMLIPYFGRWPAWINLFIESCKWNPDVHWRFYTDCGEPENKAGNVDYVHVSFEDYLERVSERLGIAFVPTDPYKLCDLRPCLAFIHEREVGGFEFFGYGDIDVIYGNIGRFYTEEIRERFDVLSTHPERLSGHFAVLRNAPAFRDAFRRIPGYRTLLEQPAHTAMDEGPFKSVFRSGGTDAFDIEKLYFEERYSTVLSPRGWHDGTMNYPQNWFWRRGCLTNERDGGREFLYLHFMRWQSGRWQPDFPAPGEAAWVGLEQIVRLDWRLAVTDGFCISPAGFTPIGPEILI